MMPSMAPVLVVLGAVVAVASASAQSWPQFKGAGSRGVAVDAASYPQALEPDRNLLWKAAIDAGHSSPVVWGERLFATTCRGTTLAVVCLATADGRELWRRELEVAAVERHHDVNSAASATPAVDGERIVAAFGSLGLVCWDHEGEELWRREHPRLRNTFGAAASPVLVEGRVVYLRDTNEASSLEVLDARDGSEVWRVVRTGFASGWSTPVVWDNAGVREILAYGTFQLTAYDFATGAERWSVPGLADEPCITPVVGDGVVYVTSYNMRTSPEAIGLPPWKEIVAALDRDGDQSIDRTEAAANKSVLSRSDADGEGDHPLLGFFRWLDADRDGELVEAEWQKLVAWLDGFEHANALVALRPGGREGHPDAEVLWQQPRGVPECPSPLWFDGRVYLTKNGGLVTCVDAASGEVCYHARMGARGPRYASPVAAGWTGPGSIDAGSIEAGGLIYACSARGQVTVLRPGPTLDVVSNTDLGERIMATPALVDGVVYVRTAQHVMAFGSR